jgi:hypothetical protein
MRDRAVSVTLATLLFSLLPVVARGMEFPGAPANAAAAIVEAESCRLENEVIRVSWHVVQGRLRPGPVVNRRSKEIASPNGEAFSIVLNDGRVIRASDLRIMGAVVRQDLPAEPGALRSADQGAGKRLAASLAGEDGTIEVQWQATLRDGSNYVRQELAIRPRGKDLALAEIALVESSAEGARTCGTVPGSPVTSGDFFFACEDPLADNRGQGGRIRCALKCDSLLKAGQTLRCASVAGVAPPGQMRRAFLCYIERERPRPYRPFLHYNSWYDIAWNDRKFNERQALEVIECFDRELFQKRGVRLDSFVFDDGWDDSRTLWGFHAGFPNGFTPLRDAAGRCRSSVGVWLSPWGGYGSAQTERLEYGRTQGYEINAAGFSLAGPKYYARFRDRCRQMVEGYGVNFFKFDGVGAGMAYEKLTPGQRADIVALMGLADELRRLWPDLYLSITTGTWPSPYWLWHGDSVWRNGDDCGFCGQGSPRQQWINYRDATTQQMVVRRAPLFPLNSVMNQGITYAKLGTAARMANDLKDVVDEIRMFFGCGTQLQELYVTPQMMTPPMWDALAEAAAWSRSNADVLVDAHWIGGDAGKSEPYGYASWSPRKGILCVRNPNREPKTLSLHLADAFELPADAARQYTLKSPWKADAGSPAQSLAAEADYRIELRPFEVRVLEAIPREEDKTINERKAGQLTKEQAVEIAERELRTRMANGGYTAPARLESSAAREERGWIVHIWRLPKRPGGHSSVVVSDSGKVLEYRAGK